MVDYYSRSFFPPFRYHNYYRSPDYYNNRINFEKENSFEKEEKFCDSKKSNISEKPIFELFGIELFFDDILLISLIFFLYNEGVKDQFLFIALILLLIS